MDINITAPISVDTCRSVIQSEDCNRFTFELACFVEKLFLESNKIDSSAFDITRFNVLDNVFASFQEIKKEEEPTALRMLRLQKGSITVNYLSKNDQKLETYIVVMDFSDPDLSKLPLEDPAAMREIIRTTINEEIADIEAEGLTLTEKLQRRKQDLWDPQESWVVTQWVIDRLRSEKNRATISKLDQFCRVFKELIQQDSIGHEKVESCSIFLKADFSVPAGQTKEEL